MEGEDRGREGEIGWVVSMEGGRDQGNEGGRHGRSGREGGRKGGKEGFRHEGPTQCSGPGMVMHASGC